MRTKYSRTDSSYNTDFRAPHPETAEQLTFSSPNFFASAVLSTGKMESLSDFAGVGPLPVFWFAGCCLNIVRILAMAPAGGERVPSASLGVVAVGYRDPGEISCLISCGSAKVQSSTCNQF